MCSARLGSPRPSKLSHGKLSFSGPCSRLWSAHSFLWLNICTVPLQIFKNFKPTLVPKRKPALTKFSGLLEMTRILLNKILDILSLSLLYNIISPMSRGLSLGRAQAGPKPLRWLRLQIQQARALQSWALAAAFRPSQAGTSLCGKHWIASPLCNKLPRVLSIVDTTHDEKLNKESQKVQSSIQWPSDLSSAHSIVHR